MKQSWKVIDSKSSYTQLRNVAKHPLAVFMCCVFLFYLFVFAIGFYLCVFVFPFPRHTLRNHQRQSQFAEISETTPFSDVIAPWHFCKPLPSIVCKELRNATHVPPDAMAKPMATPKLAKPKLAKPEVGEA